MDIQSAMLVAVEFAEWADIDLDGTEWRYTATKTDTPHVVPLARQAVEILRELHPVTGHHRYVFPNARYRQRDRTMSNTTFGGGRSGPWTSLRNG